MTYLFLGLLALAWLVVFLPAMVRARRTAPITTAERFKRSMELIAPRSGAGRWVVVPEPAERLGAMSFRKRQRRRRRILALLLALVVVTLGVAVVARGPAWDVQVGTDFALALYVSALLEAKRRRAETRSKVRRIAPRDRRDPERARRLVAVSAAADN